jgi:hemerythrin-like domain-containing protein
MADCTEDLRSEHQGVLLMIDILGAMEDRFEQGQPVPPEDMREALDFLRTFVDRCHHAKEEGLLFPAMQEAHVADADETIERLEDEHVRGRELVGRIGDGIDRLDAGDISAGRELAEDLHAYGELLRRHIEVEDDVLYPMAADALPPAEQARLVDGYERIERDEVGEGRHEAYHEMLGRMKADYLDRSQPLKSG